ncbi:MAG: ABC transporter permease [Saccharofermentans sp.]|nr:ABC transporter permease [Saccharofermentans sp.]
MFKYYLLKNLRNVMFLFWSFVFPLALMTCMYMAFGDVYDMVNSIDPHKTILVAEDDSEFSVGFEEVMHTMSDETSDNYYFDLTEDMSLEEAKESIKKGESETLFVVSDGNIEVFLCNDHSMTAAIVSQSVANTYRNKYEIISDAFAKDPQAALEIMTSSEEMSDFTEARKDVFSGDPNVYSWYFYSSLVMGIFFNATGGAAIVSDLKADVSCEAMRFSASPEKKSKMLLYSFLSRLIPALAINAFQLVIMNKVFDVSLGNDILKLITFIVAANVFSISFGIICGIIFKGTLESRANKTTAIIMTSVFLSGEMLNTLPGTIEKYCPIVNDINPATVMNMTFYRMSLYSDSLDFYLNMAKIVGAGVIFLAIGTLILRREKYASL